MRTFLLRVVAFAVGVASVAACGRSTIEQRTGGRGDDDREGAAPAFDERLILADAAELGACPADLERSFRQGMGDHVPLQERMFQRGTAWYVADHITEATDAGPTTTTREDRSIPVELVGARRLTVGAGDTPSAVRSLVGRRYGPSWEQTALGVRRHDKLYVAVEEQTQKITLVVATDNEGRIAFVGQCEIHMATTGIANYLDHLSGTGQLGGRTAEDVLSALVSDPAGPQAADLRRHGGTGDPVSWSELPPDRRAYDPDAMPEELQAQLEAVVLLFELPEAWRDRTDIALCTRTPLFWGDCTGLDAYPGAEPVRLVARMRAHDPIDVWLSEAPPMLSDNKLGLLVTLDPDTVAAAVRSQTPIVLVLASGVESIEALVERARTGEPSLVVAR